MNTTKHTQSTFSTLSVLAISLLGFGSTGCVDEFDEFDEFDEEGELRELDLHFDLEEDMTSDNPNGVWSYGYGTVGGDFILSPTYVVSSLWGGDWGVHGGGAGGGWRGLFHNSGGEQNPLGVGPGEVFLHSGHYANPVTKVRFSAPADGCYALSFDGAHIDTHSQGRRSEVEIYTNAASAEGPLSPAGFKQLHSEMLVNYPAATSFEDTILLEAGEVLSFEYGNGGDGNYYDAISVDLSIEQAPCSP